MLSASPLDAACRAALERILRRVTGRDFDRLRETVPAFRSGGFRPGNTEAFRALLRMMVFGETPFPEEVRTVLSAYAPPSSITSALPVETLCALRTALAGFFGASPLVAALLLDVRPEVRSLAESWLAEGFTEGEAPEPEGEAPASSENVRELRAENRRLAAIAAEAERTKNALKRLEAEATLLRKRLADAESQASAALRERDAARAEWTCEIAHREERVRARVEAELATAAFAPVHPETEAPGRGGEPPPPTSEGKLSLALTNGMPCLLLIDGHNTQYGMPSRYNPQRGKRMTEYDKRQRLLRDVAELIAPSPAMRACVVFDAPEHSEAEAGERVRVVFSGGKGDHRADRVLLDQIRFLRTCGDVPCILLVSDDRELCKKARKLGAETLPVLEFGSFLPTTLTPSR
ncbi:MAG: NYN domain-containing protein [Kiritimatiellae bacterium]|nr:NYN domain-containing protein [Kiritimatiellia bacterium]